MQCPNCSRPMRSKVVTGRERASLWVCRACDYATENKVTLQGKLALDPGVQWTKVDIQQKEHWMQVGLFNKVKEHEEEHPLLKLFYAIPNGGHRTETVAKAMKAEGTREGAPDTCWPIARHGYNSLYIELKIPKNNPSAAQLTFGALLLEEGNRYVVCYSLAAAWAEIEWYYGQPIGKMTTYYLAYYGDPVSQ